MTDNNDPAHDPAPVPYPVQSRPQIVNDPVLDKGELGRFQFVRNRPAVSADRALVLMTASGETVCYPPDRQPTRGELVSRNFRRMYEVVMGYHHLPFEHRLPSAGDAFFFHAETDVTWQVEDPAAVVRKRVRDLRALLEPRLLARMRQASRSFDIERSAAAETAVHDALAATPLADAEGISVTCAVRLSLDQEAIRQYSAIRGLDYARTHAENEHLLERLRTRNEQELTTDRTEFYASMLERGDIHRWAMQVASNPDDLPLALEGIRDDAREAMTNQVAIVGKLLDAGALEEHHLEETARLAVESLKAPLLEAAQGRTRKQPLYREQLDAGKKALERPDGLETDGPEVSG